METYKYRFETDSINHAQMKEKIKAECLRRTRELFEIEEIKSKG